MPIADKYKRISRFIMRDDLLDNNYSRFMSLMSPCFSKWSQHSETVFHEFSLLCKDDPEFVFQLIHKFITETELLTTLLSMARYGSRKSKRSPLATIECLASCYEITPILKLPVLLLSRKKATYDNLKKTPAIFKHFRTFGFSYQDAENMRLIRNAVDHRFNFLDDKLILKDGQCISIQQCEDLLDKYEEILSWWMTCVIFCLFCIPRLSLLAFVSFYRASTSNNDLKAYYNGMELFFADIIEKQAAEKKKKKGSIFNNIKDSVNRIKHKALTKFTLLWYRNTNRNFKGQAVDLLLRRIDYYLSILKEEVQDISDKCSNTENKNWFAGSVIWLNQLQKNWQKI